MMCLATCLVDFFLSVFILWFFKLLESACLECSSKYVKIWRSFHLGLLLTTSPCWNSNYAYVRTFYIIPQIIKTLLFFPSLFYLSTVLQLSLKSLIFSFLYVMLLNPSSEFFILLLYMSSKCSLLFRSYFSYVCLPLNPCIYWAYL